MERWHASPSGYQKPQHDCLLSVYPVTLSQVIVDRELDRLYGSEMVAIKRLIRNLLNITGFFRLGFGTQILRMSNFEARDAPDCRSRPRSRSSSS